MSEPKPEPDPDDAEDLDAIEDLMQRALGGEPLGDVLARLPSNVAREADVLLEAQSLFGGATSSHPDAPAPAPDDPAADGGPAPDDPAAQDDPARDEKPSPEDPNFPSGSEVAGL